MIDMIGMKRRKEVHERFLELSARAEVCALSEAEFREFQEHLKRCSACREEAGRLRNLFWNASLAGGTDSESDSDVSEFFDLADEQAGEIELQERLARMADTQPSRVIQEVVPISISVQVPVEQSTEETGPLGKAVLQRPRVRHSASLFFGAIAATCLLAAGALGYRSWNQVSLNRSQAAEIARLDGRVKDLQAQVSTLGNQRSASIASVESQLSASRGETAKFAKHSADLEERLNLANAQVQNVLDQLAAEKGSESELAGRLHDEQAKVAQMSGELEVARKNAADSLAQSAKEAAIRADLEARLKTETEAIDRDKRLFAADRDIRNVMGARNLHIIDVTDVSGDGKTKKSFGRVFYTEGKSLIFYAFDLGTDRRQRGMTDAAFQVWGSQGWERKTAHSLGIFYQDDKNDANRWVLKFSDPNVLAEIDSVFVTLEPPGGSKKPMGRELLQAYLNSKVNHP